MTESFDVQKGEALPELPPELAEHLNAPVEDEPAAERFTFRTTDLRNAERLVEMHGANLRHVGAWGKWLAWDGRRWAEDEDGGALRCASDTARVLASEARDELAKLSRVIEEGLFAGEAKSALKRADKVKAWCEGSQNAKRLAAMLELAASFEEVAVTVAALDADPWLLNVQNGTLDLRTGTLRPFARADLVTKLAPVEYDEAAKCPTWIRFVERAMGDDGHLVSYLQRFCGYALTGSVREHALAFFYGGGANGKSTFLSTLHSMLGDYAAPAPRGLLFRSKNEQHPTTLASLHGRRFVTGAEIEAGQAFDEALVKDLTGGDPISARRMREDFWNFMPTHKLFIAGNHKPSVRGDDDGIWRRIRLVPWTVTIPPEEQDKHLTEKLHAELPGILAWSVRGCLEWQVAGALGDPPAVRAATAEYREESDVLGQFFAERLAFHSEGRTPRKVLRATYESWCQELGYQPMGARALAQALKRRGVVPGPVREGTRVLDGWKGVRVANAEDRAQRSWFADPVAGAFDDEATP